MQIPAYVPVLISVMAIMISFWAAWIAAIQRRNTEKEMALRAYETAIRGILDLKKSFADHPEVFDRQLSLEPKMRDLIPSYMDPTTFLLFAGGMWRMSFVYTAWKRGEQMGVGKDELDAIEGEMKLWLQDVPGFYDVYVQHTEVLDVHNEDFLTYLKEEVYNKEYRREKEPGRIARTGQQSKPPETK
jgi:hypothetical protein